MSFLLTEIILRLRAAAPLFEGRVTGTQSFVAATSVDADIEVPAVFVVPMFDTAEARDGNIYAQHVTERFATIVAADNRKDPRKGRGYAADVVLRTGRQQLANALMNWAPTTMQAMDPVAYARSQHLFMNDALVWHQYEWTCAYWFAGQEDPQDMDNYEAIQKIIRGGWPSVDAAQIAKLMTNRVPGATIDPADQSTYDTIFEVVHGITPDWIKFKPHNAFRAQTTVGEDTVTGQPGHRRVVVPPTTPPPTTGG